MNLRKIEEVMISILIILIGLIIITLIVKSSKNNSEDDLIDEETVNEITEGGYISETNINLLNYDIVYDYFEDYDKADKCEEYIKEALKDYGTTTKEFNVTDMNYQDNKLSFHLVSSVNIEEYVVTVASNETLLERIN